MSFRTTAVLAAREAERGSTKPFEAGSLADTEKERLCRALLSEFGVTSVQPARDGELIHNCSLPWHDERNPSASLNWRKLTYNCFGCGSSGGLLWYIATCRGEDGGEARRWLDDQTGMGSDEQSLSSLLDFFDAVYGPKAGQASAPIPRMDRRVLNPWLMIHPYLTEIRRIPEDNLKHFWVGYAEDYLAMRTDNGDRIRSQRIVIPHFWRGDLTGWQTRRLLKDGTAKYQSSPDFPKDTTIYNYDDGRDAVVVESPMSVIAAIDICPVLEATFGAKITDRQVRLISQHRRTVLWFDNDEAGWKATHHLGNALESYCPVFVVDSPWAGDIADLRQAGLDEEIGRLIGEPVPFSLWKPPSELQALPEAA